MKAGGNGRRREAVLGAIRQSLGGNRRSAEAMRELDKRIAGHRANLIPQSAQGSRREIVDRFVGAAEAAACTVERVASEAELPRAVSDYLRRNNLPTDITMAPDDWLTGLDWASQPMLEMREGVPRNEDLVGLTPAFAGVAETGTLVMASGENHPATLNFMPDYHVVALKASQIAGGYEEAFERLRAARGTGNGFDMPRTLNLITGPSCTGDIELTIHLGAHGPRSLHIVLIDDETADDG